MRALLAVDGTRVLGLAHMIFHRNTIMPGMTCYLQDLFTAPAARGRGIGRQLILAVYDRARRSGATRVYWHRQETNHAARSHDDAVARHSGLSSTATRFWGSRQTMQRDDGPARCACRAHAGPACCADATEPGVRRRNACHGQGRGQTQ